MFTPTALPKISGLNKAFTALAGTGGAMDFLPRRGNIINRSSRLAGTASVSSLSTHKSRRMSKAAIEQEAVAAKPDAEQDLNVVFDAMMFLPKDQRRILTMVCIQGMRYADVAEKLNMPIDSMRERLSHARDALQQFLDGDTTGNTPSPHLIQRN